MGLRQTLYFMSLVSGMSGLFAWAIVRLVEATLTTENGAWVSNLITTAVLETFIGGLTVAFSNHYSGNRTMPRWIISGAFIGLCAELAERLLQIPITRNLTPSS